MKIKLLLLLIIIFIFNTKVFAESLHPNEVVRLFIQSIQQNNIKKILVTADLVKIASHPRHGMSLKQLENFFKNIDLEKIKFEEREYLAWPEFITVRIFEPISYDFDLELQKATFEKQEDYYIVVSVHP